MILYYAKVSSGGACTKEEKTLRRHAFARDCCRLLPRTSTILDQGPIDTCNLEVQTSKLQSIHCGLPASWTRARRHPPSSPSPVASRGGGRALAFLNWTRVQLDRPLARREASNMGVYAQLSSGPISLPTAVRTAYPAQRAWFGSRAARFASGSHNHHPEEALQGLPPGSEGRLAPARANYCRHYRAPRAASRYLSHQIGFRCIIREGSTA